MGLLSQVCFIVLVLVAIRQGFITSNPAVLLSWPMFSNFSTVDMRLREVTSGRSLNMWAYFRHMDYALDKHETQQFLDFLHSDHGLIVEGSGVWIEPDHEDQPFDVRNSRVDR